jgi:hypothetical protein
LEIIGAKASGSRLWPKTRFSHKKLKVPVVSLSMSRAKRYTFETGTRNQTVANLPPRSTIHHAKAFLAQEFHCSPADLHIFWNGRECGDQELIPEPETYAAKKYPVVYRPLVLGAAAQSPPPVQDPEDFQEVVDGLLMMVDNKVPRADVERIVREVDNDLDIAVERVIQLANAPPPATGIPADVRRQLEQAKPAHMGIDEAIMLYIRAMGQDLEATLAILRGQ